MTTSNNTINQIDLCLQKLSQGDSSAFDLLFERSYRRLCLFARHNLNRYPTVRNHASTQDVLHNVFLKLLSRIKESPPSSAAEYFGMVSKTMRHYLIDEIRRLIGRMSSSEIESGKVRPCRNDLFQHGDGQLASVGDLQDNPEKLARLAEFHSQVELLDEELRQVLDLIYYQGFTQEQTAEFLHTTRRVVRNRLFKAKLALTTIFPNSI